MSVKRKQSEFRYCQKVIRRIQSILSIIWVAGAAIVAGLVELIF